MAAASAPAANNRPDLAFVLPDDHARNRQQGEAIAVYMMADRRPQGPEISAGQARSQGRAWYCLHILRDRKYIANAVPREVTNRHIRVAAKVTPNSLKNRASQ